MKKLLALSTLTVGLLLMPMATLAESTPEAKKWIDGLMGLYEKGPLQVEIEGIVGGAGGTITGVMLVKDRSRQRVRLNFSIGQGMKMDILTVSDGTITWSEINSPMGKQVIKISLEEAKKMAEQGMGGLPGMGSVDPFSMTEQLTEEMDFKVLSQADGKVTLEGVFKDPEAGGAAGLPFKGITLTVDEKTGFLDQIVAGGEQPVLTMTMKNLTFLKEADLESGAFEYTPPEGVAVTDAAQLMAMRNQAQGSGGR